MNRILLLIFCSVVLNTGIFSQSEETQTDTSVLKLEIPEPYPLPRLHVTLGYGSFLKLNGNTSDVYSKMYHQGIDGEKFAGDPYQMNSKKDIVFGVDFSIMKRVMIGLFILPSEKKSFVGGTGTNYYSPAALWGLFPASVNYLQGVYVHEKIKSFNYGLRGAFILLPFNGSRKEGIQLMASAGLFLNSTEVTTELHAFDYVFDGSVTKAYDAGQNFSEQKQGLGSYFNLRMDIRFARLFSIFSEITQGFGPKYTISQKSFSFMSQTALAPEHHESLSGFGASLGIALHFLDLKTKK
jgi:hypothetical protein